MPDSSLNAMPTVSIILPTYNRAKFLPEAFAAISSQTFTDWELIVVDDGSTDGTPELVPQLTSEFRQPVRYTYQQNQGAYGARNTGLEQATGKYFAFYDSDDLWLPHHLNDCVVGLEENPSVDWVYGACRIVDHASGDELVKSTFSVKGRPRPFTKLQHRVSGQLNIIEDAEATRCQILHGFYCGLQNSVIRRRLFQDYRFDAASRNEAEDQIIVIKALKAGRKFAWINNVHVTYRVHDANSSASSVNSDADQKVHVLEKEINGFEDMLKQSLLSSREIRALRRNLSEQYFWKLGYSLLWMRGRREQALTAFQRGLRHWPWDWRCWKTCLMARMRYLLNR